jgi:DNA-3-methyladenine glycosylase II
LRGFGPWSAEIYLMFSLQRSDIFPAGDLALRIALQKLKGIDTPLNEKQSRELVALWSPYRSAGSLFLWHYYRGAPT